MSISSPPFSYRSVTNLLKLTTLLISAFAILGCASAPSIDLNSYPGKQKTAVFTTFGNKATLSKLGLTIFGNKYEDLDASTWDINEHIRKSSEDILSKTEKLDIRQIELSDNDALPPNKDPLPSNYDWPEESDLEQLINLGKEHDLDLIVFIRPASLQEPSGQKLFDLPRYGIYSWANTLVYLSSEINVVDINQAKLLSSLKVVTYDRIKPTLLSPDEFDSTKAKYEKLLERPMMPEERIDIQNEMRHELYIYIDSKEAFLKLPEAEVNRLVTTLKHAIKEELKEIYKINGLTPVKEGEPNGRPSVTSIFKSCHMERSYDC